MNPFVERLVRNEQRERALTTTASSIQQELQKPEVIGRLSTFKVVSLTEDVASPYGDHTQSYDLIVPAPESQLHPIFISGGEITYLDQNGSDVIRKCTDYDLPKIYEAIMEARPIAHQFRTGRGEGYNSSAPCDIIVRGVKVSTVRDTRTTSTDEFFARLETANKQVLKAREERNNVFDKHTGENAFERAVRRIAERNAGQGTE